MEQNNLHTASEVLVILINKGIVHTIGDKYILTGKVIELEANLNPHIVSIPESNVSVGIQDLYPKELRECSPASRLKVLYDLCNVPNRINSSRFNYLVRSGDVKTKRFVEEVLESSRNPIYVIEAIKSYYIEMTSPKPTAKFFSEGVFDTLYEEQVEGKASSNTKPDNKTWK